MNNSNPYANKGKKSETNAKKLFEQLLNDKQFVFYRCPDARQCRGRIRKQPGDFFMWYAGRSYIIEVKEVKHDFRLPKKRLTQFPKMLRYSMAGVIPVTIVFHTTTMLWRFISFNLIQEQFESKSASYVLKEAPSYMSLEELFEKEIINHGS